MPVPRNLEILNKLKPKLELGISIATFYVTTEQIRQSIFIKIIFFSSVLCFLSSALHIVDTFHGQFTGNLAVSVLFCITCIQILCKIVLLRYHRKNMLELLEKAQSLHSNFENKDINCIAEKTLTKFSNIWETCFKLGRALVYVTGYSFSIANTINGKSGVIVEIPLIPSDFPYYTQIMLFVQVLYTPFACAYLFYSEISVAFFGFEIMAAADILYDYISANRDRIQEDPDLLKIITIRYCEVMDNIKRFNNIISLPCLIQFTTSAFLSFSIFYIVRLYPRNPVGYTSTLAILFQLFIPCVFGEFIRIKMERLSTTLYLTNWYDLSLKDQKSFLLILGTTQRQYGLKAAGMYDVNIYTFIKIIKMGASWCAFTFTLETALENAA
uniref:Odorant receptor n=1 Tax=Phlebotomus papatasi TaxID=29031 RepID=A0A3F2ZED1_PHLPP